MDETVLANQITRVSVPAGGQAQVILEAAVAAFGDPTQEILVASPDRPGFARVIYNPAEVVDQALRQGPLEASIEAEDCGYRLTLTARAYACLRRLLHGGQGGPRRLNRRRHGRPLARAGWSVSVCMALSTSPLAADLAVLTHVSCVSIPFVVIVR